MGESGSDQVSSITDPPSKDMEYAPGIDIAWVGILSGIDIALVGILSHGFASNGIVLAHIASHGLTHASAFSMLLCNTWSGLHPAPVGEPPPIM